MTGAVQRGASGALLPNKQRVNLFLDGAVVEHFRALAGARPMRLQPAGLHPLTHGIAQARLPAGPAGAQGAQHLAVQADSHLLLGARPCRPPATAPLKRCRRQLGRAGGAVILIFAVPDEVLPRRCGPHRSQRVFTAHGIRFQASHRMGAVI